MPDLISPIEVSHRVPGRVWLDGFSQGWEGLAIRGMHLQPYEVDFSTPMHVLIVHRQRSAHMRRVIDGQEQASCLCPGDISLKNAGTTGAWTWSEPLDVLHIFIDPVLLDRVAVEMHGADCSRFKLHDTLSVRDDGLHALAAALADEAAEPRRGSRQMARALGMQLAVSLVRRHGEVVAPARRQGGFESAQAEAIRHFIGDNLARPLTVAGLARLVGLSSDHFGRLFRQSFGCSPHQYVVKARVMRACELLRDPEVSMAVVAADTGFADQSHFTRCFKREIGQAPGAWRAHQALAN